MLPKQLIRAAFRTRRRRAVGSCASRCRPRLYKIPSGLAPARSHLGMPDVAPRAPGPWRTSACPTEFSALGAHESQLGRSEHSDAQAAPGPSDWLPRGAAYAVAFCALPVTPRCTQEQTASAGVIRPPSSRGGPWPVSPWGVGRAGPPVVT